MKKLFSIYKPDLFRPILYKTVTRASVALCLCLLWQRFVSDGTYTIWEAPCLAVGAIFLGWAWVSYLRLDGINRARTAPPGHPHHGRLRRRENRLL